MNDVAAPSGTGLANRATFLTSLNKLSTGITVKGGDYEYLRMDKDDGVWNYGMEGQEVDPNTLWAVNPLSFQHGYIAWHQSMPEDEVLVSSTRDLPDRNSLAPVKAKNGWEDQLAVEMVGVAGKDAGVKVMYKASTVGSKKWFKEMTDAVFAAAAEGGDAFVPIIRLHSKSYANKKHGGINWNPLFDIVEWRTLTDSSAPATAKADAPKPAAAAKPVQQAEAPVDEADEIDAEYEREQAAQAAAGVPRRRQRRG